VNRRSPDIDQAGFTLVEMLVALMLLATIAMLMLLGYQTVVPAWRRTEVRSDMAREFQIAHDFLRNHLSQAYPAVVGELGARNVDFQGSGNALEFLAPLPQGSGASVIARYRIYASSEGTLRISSWLGFGERAAFSANEPSETVILSDLSAAQFSYFGSDEASQAPHWQVSWSGRKTLPQLIKVHLARHDGRPPGWPDLVVAPLVTADSECTFDPADGKCRAQ
jgi:general secretion pathway protein J